MGNVFKKNNKNLFKHIKLKLTYITRTSISSDAAQAKQINCMSKAFNGILGENFTLICPGESPYEEIDHKTIKNIKNIGLRTNLLLIFKIFFIRKNMFFTRDILLASVSATLKKSTILELHQPHRSFYTKLLFFYLVKFTELKFVTISNALKDYFIKTYKLSAQRILVAHNGVFSNECIEMNKIKLRNELGIPKSKFVFVHTGSLYKGGHEVYETLLQINIDNIHFIHVGGTLDECKKMSDLYSHSNRISFIPHVHSSEIIKYQMSADALLYINVRTSPIYWCTSPLKIFEYMSCKIPILGSNVGSVAEVLNNSNAFCYDPDVPKEIQYQAKELINNYDEAKKRAANAKEEAINFYDWYSRAKKILDFFD